VADAINPLTPNDLQRRRAVGPLNIKIPSITISAGSIVRRDSILALQGKVRYQTMVEKEKRNAGESLVASFETFSTFQK
jgi:hypothetical protein